VAIWYIFPRFGMLCQEKSGNPDRDERRQNDFKICAKPPFILIRSSSFNAQPVFSSTPEFSAKKLSAVRF
jgi:hypothetical protein